MSEPFVVISSWRVKKGKLEELERFQGQLVEILEAKEPQLLAFNAFLNDDQTEMTSIQVHPMPLPWISTCKCSGITWVKP
jgi:hypothetical protein